VVDWQDAVADHLGLGVGETRKHKTRAIAKNDVVEQNRLEVPLRQQVRGKKATTLFLLLQTHLVLPGVCETDTFLNLMRALIVELLPTCVENQLKKSKNIKCESTNVWIANEANDGLFAALYLLNADFAEEIKKRLGRVQRHGRIFLWHIDRRRRHGHGLGIGIVVVFIVVINVFPLVVLVGTLAFVCFVCRIDLNVGLVLCRMPLSNIVVVVVAIIFVVVVIVVRPVFFAVVAGRNLTTLGWLCVSLGGGGGGLGGSEFGLELELQKSAQPTSLDRTL
jgi:hypothetical protein